MPGKLIVDEIEDSGGTSVIGRKNYIINGNFDIWQRGTSLTGQTSSKYLADRWRTEPSTTTYDYNQGTFTVGQTDVPNNPQFYADFTITGADDNFRPEQRIEDVRTLAGETITISFWAKYTSNAPTDFRTTIRQYFGSGGSSDVYTVFASGQTLTTSWQKFEVTGTVPSISGKTIGTGNLLSISPFWNGNNETFDVQIAQVQVEKGSVATDFEVRPIAEELALCQRYFECSYATAPSTWGGSDHYYDGVMKGYASDAFIEGQSFKVEKRTSPTITFYSKTGTSGNLTYNGSSTATTVTSSQTKNHINRIYINGTTSTQCFLIFDADAEL